MVKRVLLIGSGSIGRRHLAVVRERLPVAEVTLLRRPAAPPLEASVAAAVQHVVDDLADALVGRPDLAIVATPAPTHVPLATSLADAGIPMLLEKPLSDSLDGVEALAASVRSRGLPVVVGYTLRYHPAFRALEDALRVGTIGRPLFVRAEVGQHLSGWRAETDYRATVTAQQALGGGALLELSHEIDLVRAMLGMPTSVSARLDRIGDLDVDVEDIAELVLRHEVEDQGPALSTIHLDLLRRPMRRRLVVAGTDGTLELDLLAGTVTRTAEARDAEGLDVPVVADRNELYLAELDDLLQAIEGETPRVGLADAIATQRIVDAARRSAADGRVIELVAAG